MEPEVLDAGDEGQSAELVETPEEPVDEHPDGSEPVETDTPSSAFVDEESASKDPVVTALIEKTKKDIEARLTQSFKDRQADAVAKAKVAEQQALYQQTLSQAAQWRQGEAAKSIWGLLQQAEAQINEGKTATDVWNSQFQTINAIQQRIDQAAATQTFATIIPVFNEALLAEFPDYTAPPALAEAAWGSVHRYDMVETFKALMKVAADAADKDPKRATRLEAEVRAKVNNDSKVQTARATAAARQGRAPTLDVAAGGTSKGYTLQQIDAMSTNEWLALGDAKERAAILQAARIRASRG